MQKTTEFTHLKRTLVTFDWLPIATILGKTEYSCRGRKKEFLPINIFRAFILNSYLLLDDNTLNMLFPPVSTVKRIFHWDTSEVVAHGETAISPVHQ